MTARPKNHEWLALTTEAPLEPDLPICDPHHHLWDLQSARLVAALPAGRDPGRLGAGHNVVSTVFIECGAMFKPDGPEALRPIGETEFVNGIAAMSASGVYGQTRVAAGIIGTADLRLGDRVAERARRADRRGWRPLPRHPPGRRLGRRSGRAAAPHQSGARACSRATTSGPGFAHLAPRRLTFEAWCYHRQIPDVTALARAFPDTTIILNHFGGPLGVGPYAGRRRRGVRPVAHVHHRAGALSRTSWPSSAGSTWR